MFDEEDPSAYRPKRSRRPEPEREIVKAVARVKARAKCEICKRPPWIDAHYPSCPKWVPEAEQNRLDDLAIAAQAQKAQQRAEPRKPCVVCQRGPDALAPGESIIAGRCSKCRELTVNECNAIIAARIQAQYAAEEYARNEPLRRENERKEQETRARIHEQLLSMLKGDAPTLALGEGTESTVVDTTALIPANPTGSAMAVVQNHDVATERRRRRAACDAAQAEYDERYASTQKRLAEIALEAEPLNQPYHAITKQIQAIERRSQHVVEEFVVFAPTQADADEVEQLRDRWEATRQALRVLAQEREDLEDMLLYVWEPLTETVRDYQAWKDVEQAIRLDTLKANKVKLVKLCARCRSLLAFDHPTDFCSEECARKPEYQGIWFPKCDSCKSHFIADADGGHGEIPTSPAPSRTPPPPSPEEENADDGHEEIPTSPTGGRTFCSYQCVLTSNEDLDFWPGEDAECWRTVILMPHPLLTSAARAAENRRRVLDDARRRVTRGLGDPRVSVQPALSPRQQAVWNFLTDHAWSTDAEMCAALGLAPSTLKDARHRFGDWIESDGGRPARYRIAARSLAGDHDVPQALNPSEADDATGTVDE